MWRAQIEREAEVKDQADRDAEFSVGQLFLTFQFHLLCGPLTLTFYLGYLSVPFDFESTMFTKNLADELSLGCFSRESMQQLLSTAG